MFTNYRYFTDGKTIVVALSSYAGRPVKGVAKCGPDDTFDLEKGKALAAARCNFKIAYKRKERATTKYYASVAEFQNAQKKLDDVCDYLKNSDAALKQAVKDLKDLESTF